MDRSAEYWMERLRLAPHPEGGWFRETYRSREVIAESALPSRFRGERTFATGIYFLLQKGEFSAFHSINQDETWHFYDGGALTLHVLDPEGDYRRYSLGLSGAGSPSPQITIPSGWLFAAETEEHTYTLAGCTVAPGFEFADFHMPARDELTRRFPQHREIITRFTRV
ncbi:cupin domain-containing protein [bacterium]|nr:cupin domain-containing protein [bacterium]